MKIRRKAVLRPKKTKLGWLEKHLLIVIIKRKLSYKIDQRITARMLKKCICPVQFLKNICKTCHRLMISQTTRIVAWEAPQQHLTRFCWARDLPNLLKNTSYPIEYPRGKSMLIWSYWNTQLIWNHRTSGQTVLNWSTRTSSTRSRPSWTCWIKCEE